MKTILLPYFGIAFSLIFSPVMGQTKAIKSDIVYEIFVQSYCDSNGDGIGDLNGLTSKLDYIQELGATSIWLMPIHPSPSYHKYDVTDYYAIHPDYGTMADMEKLIAEAHQRNIKVILDLVVNHTSSKHPWFITSASSEKNAFRDYYVWRNLDEVKDEIEKKETTFDSDNVTQWHTSGKQKKRFYGFFSDRMPDLNFDYTPVREEVYKIGKYWLDKGVDGFRLDAAKHIYPDERLEDSGKFWAAFTSEMKKVNPKVKLIGEAWAEPPVLAILYKALPSLFNFQLTTTIPESIEQRDPMKLIAPYRAAMDTYSKAKVHPDDAILLSNHDMNRIRSTLHGDIARSKLAAAILLTLPGTPYLYYGEEIGMLGMKPDPNIREPFLWSNQSPEDSSWMIPVYSKIPDVTPLDQQKEDPNSLFYFYQKWISLRQKYPALSNGTIEFIPPEYPQVLAYVRRLRDQRIMVIHNLDEHDVELRMMDPYTNLETGAINEGATPVMVKGLGSVLLKIN